jgi:hypothetical protein
MKTYRYIEEYIEIIAGIRDPVTNKTNVSFLSASPLSLARYDVNVIASLGEQVSTGGALTDKQADLCVKIITKYERQLAKLGIDIAPVGSPVYRMPLRQIDRTCCAWVADDKILVKFPYTDSLIKIVRDAAKTNFGQVFFCRNTKVWKFGLTEYNVNWVHAFASTNQFEIDQSLQQLMDQLLEFEKQDYKIELTVQEHKCVIKNAAPELIKYIQDNIGGFDQDNLYNLIDHADILGYTIDPLIEELFVNTHGARLYNLMINRDSKLGTDNLERSFQEVINYAERTNRWPVYVYEPDMSNKLLDIAQKNYSQDIVSITNQKDINTDKKIVHFNRYVPAWNNRVPLLISSAGMLFSGDKQLLLERAEKVVYLTHEVYNKVSRGASRIDS